MTNEPSGRQEFVVRYYEVDLTGCLSPVSLCNYLQEAAGNSAHALGFSIEDMGQENLTWVLVRLFLQMDRYPAQGERIVVHTWPSSVERIFATRDFLITDAEGHELGRATTAWLMADTVRRRPVRIKSSLLSASLSDRDRALRDDLRTITCPDTGGMNEMQFRVRQSDLDVNRHVNNVRYVEWLLESVPADFQSSHALRELKIQFKTETMYGDVVASLLYSEEDAGRFAHRISRVSDGRELAAAQTVWNPRDLS